MNRPSPYPSSEWPFGFSVYGDRLRITAFSHSANALSLQLFDPQTGTLVKEKKLEREHNSLWKGEFDILDPNLEYQFLVDNSPALDPYAKLLSSPYEWGKWEKPLRCNFSWDLQFDWQKTSNPMIKRGGLVIYEMHVRGFTRSPTSKVTHPGSFLGIVEKIPYLLSLGVNMIELMPSFEFDERGHLPNNPNHWNYWGYSSISFFAPMRRFTAKNTRLAPLEEFKYMVRELHKAGIGVILDVVYNHVDPLSTLDTWDRSQYFILDKHFNHTNYTGCGNTVSANSHLGMQLILTSLRYFVEECHVDGFRFDLAASLTRGKSGEYLFRPPLFQAIEADPILSKVHLIGEPWDCSTLHLQGKFPCSLLSEWNAFFRDDVRKFVRGDPFVEKTYLEHLTGNSYIVKKRDDPTLFVNYTASHDGFSAQDLVSYEHKHNELNGENNRDGEGHTFSSNYGVEGHTDDPHILTVRKQQRENLIFSTIFCRGISMFKMGDEYGLSHDGNNNPYCLDGPINWFDWTKTTEPSASIEKIASWIRIKCSHPFFSSSEITHDHEINWLETNDSFTVCIVKDTYLFAANMSQQDRSLNVDKQQWQIIASTGPYSGFPEMLLSRTILIAKRV